MSIAFVMTNGSELQDNKITLSSISRGFIAKDDSTDGKD